MQRGTLDYMAPEVFRAYSEEDEGAEAEGPKKQPVTQAVDIYSFGLVLWQLLTGEHPDKTQGSLRQPRQALHICSASRTASAHRTLCSHAVAGQRPEVLPLCHVIAFAVLQVMSPPASGKHGQCQAS